MKGWKQALFLGGAVLLLAACSDSTAPVAPMQEGKGPASASLLGTSTTTTTTTTLTPLPKPTDLCKTPVVIQLGKTETTDSSICLLQY